MAVSKLADARMKDRVTPDLAAAIPCPSCGAELYDRVVKYHLGVECEVKPCYVMAHWSLGSFCRECKAEVGAPGKDAAELAAERIVLFGDGR